MAELIEILPTLPRIEVGMRRGVTDYMDFLRPEDVTEACMQGVDYLDRRFIVVKFTNAKTDVPCAWALFQRYSGNANYWTVGGCPPPSLGFSRGINMSLTIDEQDDRYKENVLEFFLAAAKGREDHVFTLFMFDDEEEVTMKFL